MEIVDSSQMQVLSEFDYVDEVFNGTKHYSIGVLNENVLVCVSNESDGKQRGTFLYERVNHTRIIAKIEDIYAGKLKELDKDYFSFKNGKDFLVIGITSTFPHTSFKPITSFNITNNRRVIIDNLELGNWDLYMSVETGKLFLAELKRIKNQIGE
ncbi:MAG: hypothetical protein ACR2LT_00740 [Pyrinomonadaceae bacterium]